ncbi:MAG: inositol monophosphatase family protein, partial [Gemmatimonadales bacterium]
GLDCCYSAGAGLGAYRNGMRLRIRDLPRGGDLFKEVISAGDRSRFVLCGRARAFDALMAGHPQVRGYTDCIGHTLAAQGAIGAALDYGVRLWDIAATQVLIEEAGGRFVCTHQVRRGGQTLYGIICGKPRVVEWLLPLFKPLVPTSKHR